MGSIPIVYIMLMLIVFVVCLLLVTMSSDSTSVDLIRDSFLKKPTDGDDILCSNITKLQGDKQCRVLITSGLFYAVTPQAKPDIKQPLIQLDMVTFYGLNKVEYIFEAGLRLLAKNDEYPTEATMIQELDNSSASKRIFYKFKEVDYVMHIFVEKKDFFNITVGHTMDD
jgi:hypothetical protein